MRRAVSLLIAVVSAGLVVAAGAAIAKTSHEGWPAIDGVTKMHTRDQSSAIDGTSRNDELLGGHGSDTLWGRGGDDVLWGDYKPGGQPAGQVDHINGGTGNDFIYAGHGSNAIDAGPGGDVVHAHYGRGTIDCGGGIDTLFVSHRAQKVYKISRCEKLSYKSS
ncbi:MAG: calcium-binding protein [Conexibacter sp.]|nr:calcium-binding protein [Conexibacter sp.]